MKEEKDRWLYYTNPEFIDSNQRWEFYQKDQDDNIVETFESESETDLRIKHQELVMGHIVASMKKGEEETESKLLELNKDKKKEEETEVVKHTINPNQKLRGQTSRFLTLECSNKIMEMKLNGETNITIANKISIEYNISKRVVETYITKVYEKIREISKESIDGVLQSHMSSYEELYKWFNENGYSREGMKALERKERLLGLYEAEGQVDGLIEGLKISELDYRSELLNELELSRLQELMIKTMRIVKRDKDI